MKKLFLLPTFLFLTAFTGYGQVLQNANWVTPPTGLTYNSLPIPGNYSTLTFPAYPTSSDYSFAEGNASVSDMNGNILLFSDGVKLWRNDPCTNTVTEITSLGQQLKGNPFNGQGVIFIPKPGHPNIYYVVTISGTGQVPSNFTYDTGSGLYYSEVDYVAGAFVPGKVNLTLSSYGMDSNGNILQPMLINENYGNTSEAITSTIAANGIDYLLIAHVENRARGGFIFTFNVTCNEIHGKPFEWAPLTIFDSLSSNSDHSTMIKVSPKIGSQPQKIGLTSTIGTYISSYNNGTCGSFTHINNPVGNDPHSYGIEFSPSANAIYLTDESIANIYGYDLANLAIPPFLNQPNGEGGLQLGIDGRIYCAGGGVINDPDNLINPGYVPLIAGVGTMGIPEWVHWQQDPSHGSITANDYNYTFNTCLASTITIPHPSGTTVNVVGWPANCGITVSSAGVITIPAGITGGPFVIKYQLCNTNNCPTCSNIGTITLTHAKVVLTPPQVGPICAGDYLAPLPTTLNGISGSWSLPLDNMNTTTYTFWPSNPVCADPVSITIVVLPVIMPTFTGIPTSICASSLPYTLPTQSNDIPPISGYWILNGGNVTAVTQSGTYIFHPTGVPCASNFSIQITVIPVKTPHFNFNTNICVLDLPFTLPGMSSDIPPIQGSWTFSGGPVTTVTQSGNYTFTPLNGECAIAVTIAITVRSFITPTFNLPETICERDLPYILPTSSTNVPPITGIWHESVVDQSDYYVFEPTPGQCAVPISTYITVIPLANTTFTFPTISFCSGDLPGALPQFSNELFQGTWTNNGSGDTWYFHPFDEYCAKDFAIKLKVTPTVTPIFDLPSIICEGEDFPDLPEFSENVPPIQGTWAPTGFDTYTFTPINQGPCVNSVTVTITQVVGTVTPTFHIPLEICQGSAPYVLPGFDDSYGIHGSWQDQNNQPVSTINTSQTGSFTFTFYPDEKKCIEKVEIKINVVKCCDGVCPLPKIECFGFDPTNNPNDIYEHMAFVNFSSTSPPLGGITFTWYFTFYQTTTPIIIHTYYGQNPTFDVFCEQNKPVMSFGLIVSNGVTSQYYSAPNPYHPAYNIPGFSAAADPTCFKHDKCGNEVEHHYKADQEEIILYPNPAKSVVHFKGTHLDKCSIVLYDLLGNVIVNQVGLENEMNIERLATGIYVYSITDENNHLQTGKVIKQ